MTLKLLIISHALIVEANQNRWWKMAADHEVDIRILIPEHWYNPHFGETGAIHQGKNKKTARFEVCTVPTTSTSDHTRYRIKNLRYHLQDFQPDVIFCIHEEELAAHRQIIFYRQLFYPRAKLIYFSMRLRPRVPAIPPFTIKQLLKRIVIGGYWWLTRYGTDGAMVHYPGIEQQMRSEGYTKKILIQTQIGVDPDLFFPDSGEKSVVHHELGWGENDIVIGTAGRITNDKGAFDLVQAVNNLQGPWRLLMIGDGPDRNAIENFVKEKHIEDRVIITGYVPQKEVPRFMRSMDIFVLGSRTTAVWVDTFPLVVAQAMATGIPVIGSDSGAIPYQLAGEGLIYHEGNVDELSNHIQKLMVDIEFRLKTGSCLKKIANERFCIESMNYKFLDYLRKEILHRNGDGS